MHTLTYIVGKKRKCSGCSTQWCETNTINLVWSLKTCIPSLSEHCPTCWDKWNPWIKDKLPRRSTLYPHWCSQVRQFKAGEICPQLWKWFKKIFINKKDEGIKKMSFPSLFCYNSRALSTVMPYSLLWTPVIATRMKLIPDSTTRLK